MVSLQNDTSVAGTVSSLDPKLSAIPEPCSVTLSFVVPSLACFRMFTLMSHISLRLIALKTVPAPEILSIWGGVFRPRDGHVGVVLAF
jgi:hypothetical protein